MNEKHKYKRGSKGIPHSLELEIGQYATQLYGHESHFVTLRSLRLNKEKNMSRFTTKKRGLNDIFLKFDVADDAITCAPLKKKSRIL